MASIPTKMQNGDSGVVGRPRRCQQCEKTCPASTVLDLFYGGRALFARHLLKCRDGQDHDQSGQRTVRRASMTCSRVSGMAFALRSAWQCYAATALLGRLVNDLEGNGCRSSRPCVRFSGPHTITPSIFTPSVSMVKISSIGSSAISGGVSRVIDRS